MFPDNLDKRLLKELQRDSRRSVRQLAKSLDESASTVYNRVKRLEERKVIKRWTIALDYEQLSLNTTAFVLVEIGTTNGDFNHKNIAQKIADIDGVYEVYTISGEFDLLIKVRGETIQDIGKLVLEKIRPLCKKSITNVAFETIESSISFDGIDIKAHN